MVSWPFARSSFPRLRKYTDGLALAVLLGKVYPGNGTLEKVLTVYN